MEDCIFCKIAAGEIPSTIIYEDELTIAFNDLNPEAPVHVLVIPKKHFENISDDVDNKTICALIHAIDEVARITGVDKTGFRTIANTGDDAGQTIHHLHFHVLGGKPLGEKLL